MRYLIVGCGRVGSALAKLLDADGHKSRRRRNAIRFSSARQEIRRPVVVGTGIDYDILKRAGAKTPTASSR